MTTYQTILLDPPWPEQGAGKIKRGADRHYPLIRKKEDILHTILRARDTDFVYTPHDDAHMYLWVTNNYLEWGLDILAWLGFKYKTNVAWGKVSNGKPQMGIGQYFRGAHELLLFGTRGKCMKPEKAGLTLLLAERTNHSRKPASSYDLIEETSPGPRLEMFARSRRPGWVSWGNEV